MTGREKAILELIQFSKQMNEDDNAFNKSISKNKNKIFEKYLIKDIVFLAIITCCFCSHEILTKSTIL